ncbi:hypothetical protein BDY24DRAFT_418604 [Mrakia frigida]|uniref:uncharacterized protein n=1 Tax=Mrakia frigida TaxID=29902 RepID=UPI003FCC25AE
MRLFTFLFAISLLVFSLSVPNVVVASPTKELSSRTEDLSHLTNAQRFARGLGPKKPQSLGRSDSPTIPRAPTQPSPKPIPTKHHGRIKVWNKETRRELGYISKNTDNGRYRYSSSKGNALEVSFDLQRNALGGSDLEFSLDNSGGRNGLLGLVVPVGGQTLAPNSQAYFTSVRSSSANAPAQMVGNDINPWYPSESAIWNVNLLSQDLTLTWTQRDLSHPSLSFISSSGGDLAAFNSANAPRGYILVTFTFESI